MTFRARLLLVSLTTIAVGIGALLVVGNVLLKERVQAEASSVLHANADSQVSALDVTAAGVRLRDTANDEVLDRRGWVLDGDRVIERPPDADPVIDRLAVELGRQRRRTEIEGPDDTRLRAEPLIAPGTTEAVGSVVVVYSTASLERLQKAVLLGSACLAALVLLAGGLVIRSAVNGVLRPVAQMTATAESWGAQDLDRRFALGPARDELTALASTLDGLLARIAASRRHEQRFAGEVAHELRTPLAGLRARAELALDADGPDADLERTAALQAVVSQSERLGAAIDTLLAVARQELDPAGGSVDLVELAGELDDVLVTGDLVVPRAEGDPDVVRRTIAPLVDNARRHAASEVRIELSSSAGVVRLVVCDDGPGVAAHLGDRVFDPGVRGAGEAFGGAGLGLPLARRLARSCGGDVRLGDGPGGRFVLELPALGRRPTS